VYSLITLLFMCDMIEASQPMCIPSEPGMWPWGILWTYSASDVHLSCSPCKSLFSGLHFTGRAHFCCCFPCHWLWRVASV